MLAFDVGMGIDLDLADRRLKESTQRETIRHRRRTPSSFEFRPAPLRVTWPGPSVAVGSFRTDPLVECLIFDFGAVSVSYRLPLSGSLDRLLDLADALYENTDLLAASRKRIDDLMVAIGPAVRNPGVAAFVEDYAVHQIARLAEPIAPDRVIASHGALLARVLRAERGPLSLQETEDALSSRVSYGPEDAAVIDWNAAVLFDDDAEDVLAVLEYANLELLELRHLDDQLDRLLDRGYEAITRRGWLRRLPLPGPAGLELRRIARLQTDSALLFEGVNNALKLLGDQFLARVYRAASHRMHLPDWDASILRKLQTVESIYDKLSDQQTSRRMEALEWIIIVLIAVSILVAFVPGGGH
jgi:hypothetical protein